MTPLDPAAIDLPTLVSLTGLATSEHLLRRLREGGHPEVRISHGYVFQHLLGGSPTVGELAGLLDITQQGASKVVVELESLGYVERRPDLDDSRVRRVALTALGRTVIERGRTARAKLEAELLADIGPRAMKATRRTLLRLLERTGGLASVAARRVKPPSE